MTMFSVAACTYVLNRLLPEPHAGLLGGILFGTKAAISKELYDALVTTGTLHIVALSGMNITILESLVAATLLPVLGRRAAGVVTILVIISFVWFVGPSASVVRAAVMGSMALLAVVFGKQTWSIFSFLLTAGVMLLFKPAWIGDLSFQLSALATLGIILFGPTQVEIMPSVQPKTSGVHLFRTVMLEDLSLTLAAQVFTVPLILYTFHRISLVSPLTNILIGWLIQPLTALGLFTVIIGLVWLPLAQPLAWVAWVFLEYLILAIELTAKIPFASLGG